MILDSIEILTNDLKGTKEFYQQVLALPVNQVSTDCINIKIGQSTLKFIESKERVESIYHLAFNVPENRLEETIKWCEDRIELIQKEDKTLIADFETWNANSIYFYDNNGNLLEFIARHDLKNTETNAFDSDKILNISEIGIVKNNPLEFGNKLIEDYGLSLFQKNDNSELFMAIGDDNGLLIIVKTDRNWYPTEIPAKSNRTKIELTNKGLSKTIQTE